MNVLLKKMFENRKYSLDFFNDMMSCDFAIPKNIDVLCKHLHNYRLSGKQVVLLTDFDFDGICSGTIGFAGMAELGFNVALYMPDTNAGYGFDSDTIDDLVSKFPDCAAILTGDVGITAIDGIARARDLGLDIFVTDHHKGFGDAGAVVTVDPQRDCDPDAYSYICGAAVMYHVLRYYAEHYTTCPGFAIQQIDRLRVFAGFGTVSDSMPVYHENRDLIRDAISICKFLYADNNQQMVNVIPGCEVYRRAFYGLYVMFECFTEYEKLKDSFKIDEEFFAFYVAPAFNSIKRLGEDISIAYSVFFGGPGVAKTSMNQVLIFNEKRKKMVAEKFVELYEVPQPWSPYIYITDALPGICGLLAQKVLSETGEPVLVLRSDPDGSYSGSGRSPVWYPFLDIAGRDPDSRWYPAGHNPAFGIGVDNDACMDDLFDFLKKSIPEHKPSEDELKFVPDFVISTLGDGDIGLDVDVMHDFLHQLRIYHPFGNGFPKHQMLIRFRPLEAEWKLVGNDKTHLRIMLSSGVTVMCFGQGVLFPGYIDKQQFPDVVEIVGSLSYNDYMGVSGIQILGEFQDPELIAQEGEIWREA